PAADARGLRDEGPTRALHRGRAGRHRGAERDRRTRRAGAGHTRVTGVRHRRQRAHRPPRGLHPATALSALAVRRVVIALVVVGALATTYGILSARRHVDRARVTGRVAQVVIDSGIGDVTVLGSNRTDKGDVVLDDVLARSRITVQEGDIRGTCLAGGELDGFVESGIVTVSFTGTPARVRVRTRVGGVALHVPSGAYAIHAGAEKGRV